MDKQKSFNIGLSLKYMPTSESNKTAGGNLKFYYSKGKNLGSMLTRFTERVSLIMLEYLM